MRIICDSCGAKYSIADEKVRGKVFKIKCKKCSHIIIVRGTTAEQAKPVYDDKETKVFDYSGYDGPKEAAAAMAAADSGDAVWHLVIDQEQVGPLTVAEIESRFQSGAVDADTYVWREGFGDWLRLADVDDFAPLFSGGSAVAAPEPAAPAAEPAGGMFGGASLDDHAPHDDPADLFSAQAADPASAAAPHGAEGDLFGPAEPAADDGGFGGGFAAASAPEPAATADAGGGLFGGGADEGGSDPRIEPSLTGTRNENSVLFSLSNLASLASDAPKASPIASAAPASVAQPGMAESSGSEGSGLIDIRSMAQVFLGDQNSAGGMGGGADNCRSGR